MGTTFTREDLSTELSTTDITVADLDGDGNLDILALDGLRNKVTVRLGDGAGGFSGPTEINESTFYSLAVADVNGDGKLDLLSANMSNNTALVRLGDGAGGFSGSTEISVGTEPYSLAVADVNDDGKLDLLVSNFASDSVSVRLGDGLGGFSGSTEIGVGRAPISTVVADINGDGKLDLLTANSGGTASVRLGDGAGGFTDSTEIPFGGSLAGIVVADVNGDGKLDLLLTNYDGDPVSVQLGDGAGGFTVSTEIDVDDGPGSLAVGDVNGDGKLDLVTANLRDKTVSVRWGDGTGNFSGGRELAVSGFASSVKLVDIDRDGRMDIVAAVDAGGINIFYGGETTEVTEIAASTDGDGTLKIGDTITLTLSTDIAVTVTDQPELVLSNGGRAIYTGLDEDGRLKFTYTIAEGDGDTTGLSVAGVDTQNGTIYGRQAQLSFGQSTFLTPVDGGDPVLVDLNGDGNLDLLAYGKMGTISVLMGDGHGSFDSRHYTATGQMSFSNVVGDLNGDGKLDLVYATNTITSTTTIGAIYLRLGDGAGGFFEPTNISSSIYESAVTCADVNGDGKLDVLSGGSNGVVVRLGDGAGGFADPSTISISGGASRMAVADVNGDGKLDLLATDSYQLQVRIGNGDGTFSGSTQIISEQYISSITLADVNGDGKLDLLTVRAFDAAGTVLVRLGDGTGKFSAATEIDVGAYPSSVVTADMNGDGKLDLLTANDSGTVSIRLGDGACNFSGSTEIPVLSYFGNYQMGVKALAVADVNGDGKLDIVATGNSGMAVILNTSHRAAPFDGATISSADGAETGRGVDANRPDAPEITLASDAGSSSTDLLTNDGSLTIEKEFGATLSYVVDDGEASANYDPTALEDGEHTVEIRQTDIAGNVSEIGSITFTLDRKTPTVTAGGVTVSGPDISAGSGTLTTGETVKFSVTLSEDVTTTSPTRMTLKLSNGKVATYDAAASTTSKLVFSYTVGLEDISSDLAVQGIVLNGATVKDLAGNTADLGNAIANPTGTLVIDGNTGTSGADAFKGAGGAQTYRGLAGNDTYVVNHSSDKVMEAVNQGTDTVSSSVSFTLGDNIENLILTGSAALAGYGNSLANTMTGNTGNNTLDGKAGNDTLDGGSGDDILIGGAGSDKLLGSAGIDTASYAGATTGVTASLTNAALNTNDAKGDTYSAIENLTGSSYDDSLTGNTGANTLDGSTGNDILIGGAGADKLIGGTGTDTASYSGATKGVVVNLTNAALNTNDAKGDTYAAIENLTGSSYDDSLTGNTGTNILDGGTGNDILIGGAGTDRLIGGAGTDTASYAGATKGVVANLTNAAANTNDAKGDTYSAIENLTGSSYDDSLTGNTGANTLDSGTGNDTLIGGAGADKLVGGTGTDTASYAGATKGVTANLTNAAANTNDAKGDTYSAIESLTGSSYNDILTGNTAANTISGGAGDDRLYGGLGKDLLIGGSGKDTFIFDTKLGTTNIDTIDDFNVKDDTIWLDDDIFTKVGKAGDLSGEAFYAGTKAHDASDRIIYDAKSGKLWYDADGSGKGAAIQFATLDTGLKMTATDFDIIA